MTWPMFAVLAGGGLWTFFILMVGIAVGRMPYVAPRDPRGIKNG